MAKSLHPISPPHPRTVHLKEVTPLDIQALPRMPLATQLSEDQIAEMVRLRQAGRGIKALALLFHIGPDRVRRLVADAPAPPAIVRQQPIRAVEQLDEGDGDEVEGDEGNDGDEARHFDEPDTSTMMRWTNS